MCPTSRAKCLPDPHKQQQNNNNWSVVGISSSVSVSEVFFCVPVMEVASGDHGNYVEQLVMAVNNGQCHKALTSSVGKSDIHRQPGTYVTPSLIN